jgi:hypothetical protein
MHEQLRSHEALLTGFPPFVVRHMDELLILVAGPVPQGAISAAQLDRLSMLLRVEPVNQEDNASGTQEQQQQGRRFQDGGSPMDACPTPFSGAHKAAIVLLSYSPCMTCERAYRFNESSVDGHYFMQCAVCAVSRRSYLLERLRSFVFRQQWQRWSQVGATPLIGGMAERCACPGI